MLFSKCAHKTVGIACSKQMPDQLDQASIESIKAGRCSNRGRKDQDIPNWKVAGDAKFTSRQVSSQFPPQEAGKGNDLGE